MPTEELKDFGQKIGGARKDLRGTFRLDDLKTLTHIERTKLVTREMVWPTPDFQEMVETEGLSKETAATFKMLRDAFPASPITRADVSEQEYFEACRIFIEGLNAVKNAIAGAITQAEIAHRLKTDPTVAEKFCTFDAASGRTASSLGFKAWRSTAMDIGYAHSSSLIATISCAAQGVLGYTEERMLRKNPDWPAGTTRAEVAIRKHRASMQPRPDGTGYAVAFHRTIVPEENFPYYSRNTPFGPAFGKTFATKEEGDAALIAAAEKSFAEKRVAKNAKKVALLGPKGGTMPEGAAYRLGNDERNGQPASGDDYLRDFGMRGGEFGLWVNQVERQQVLDRGYDGFADLGQVLGLDKNQVSLGGTLAIAFGARGKGGINAGAAHYEPGRRVINLTKPHGEGCLAHEYGHAIDNYLGNRVRELGLPIKPHEGGYWLSHADLSTAATDNVPQENRAEAEHLIALNETVRSIWLTTKTLSQEEAVAGATTRQDKWIQSMLSRLPAMRTLFRYALERNDIVGSAADGKIDECEAIMRNLATVASAKDRYQAVATAQAKLRAVTGPKGSLAHITHNFESMLLAVSALSDQIEKLSLPGYTAQPGKIQKRTDYAAKCAEADRELGKAKPYYATNHEMFACAFEALVDDHLVAHGQRNPFIVRGTDSLVFPKGAERERLNKSLLAGIQNLKPTIPGVTQTVAPSTQASLPVSAPRDWDVAETAASVPLPAQPTTQKQLQGLMALFDEPSAPSTSSIEI